MAKTNEQFIIDSKLVHGEKYDYSLCNFTGSKNKVDLICSLHGKFSIRAKNHTSGRGCKECGITHSADKKKITFQEVVKRFREVHGDTYEYVESSYSGYCTKLTAICKQHGQFFPLPTNHISGKGCTKCAQIASRGNTADFVKSANLVHDNKYEYTLTEYVKSTEKVKIICPEHGTFMQAPSSHLQGCGCPKCLGTGFRRDRKGYLYVLEDNDLVKIGITNRKVNSRVSEINAKGKQFKIVTTFDFQNGNDAFLLEAKLLKYLRSNFSNPIEKFDGYTECFINVRTEEVISVIRGML